MSKKIINGQFIDLDKTPLEELKKISKQLKEKETEIKKQIERELEEN